MIPRMAGCANSGVFSEDEIPVGAYDTGRRRGLGLRGVLGVGFGNEAICGGNRSIPRRGWPRRLGRGLGVGKRAVFGLEVLEFLEGVAVVALGGVDAPLEAGEILGVIPESLGEFDLRFGLQGELGALLPELGFDDTETAEEPFGVDEGVSTGLEQQQFRRC